MGLVLLITLILVVNYSFQWKDDITIQEFFMGTLEVFIADHHVITERISFFPLG